MQQDGMPWFTCSTGVHAKAFRVAKRKACYSADFKCLTCHITWRHVLQDARPWPNYDTDYRPMVEVAKQEGLPVICANAPRRYVSLAGRSGREALEQLPQEARQWLAPLPYRQPSQVQTGCRLLSLALSALKQTLAAQGLRSALVRLLIRLVDDGIFSDSIFGTPQAYIHKTNWTMQQAKEELDAASKQNEELSTEPSSAGAAASIAQQCPALQQSTSAADIAAQNGLAASIAEQRSAWQGSPASLKAEQNSSASLRALQGSYAGRELPLLRHENPGPSHAEAPPSDDRPSAVQQSDSKAERAGAVQEELTAGAVQEQEVGAASESGQGEGCPYIGFTMSSNFLDAQCLWDATMAYSIAEGLGRDKASQQAALLQSADTDASTSLMPGSTGMQSTMLEAKREDEHRPQATHGEGAALAAPLSPLVLHVCGKFHSEGWMGIYEHIHAYHAANRQQQGCTSKQLNVVIVTFLPSSRDLALTSEEFRQERLAAYGDYVILTDYNRPRSFEIGHPV